jgi:Flp pilus assembly protein CpaB
MARKHLFPLVVILAAAVFAGLLAVSHTRALSTPAAATNNDPAIAFRLQKLDRFERSLRKQLANAPADSAPTAIYRTASVSASAAPNSIETEHEDGGRDD